MTVFVGKNDNSIPKLEFATVAEAEAQIVEYEKTDPDGVHAGDYYIDAPEELVNPNPNPLAEVNDYIKRHGTDDTPPEWMQELPDVAAASNLSHAALVEAARESEKLNETIDITPESLKSPEDVARVNAAVKVFEDSGAEVANLATQFIEDWGTLIWREGTDETREDLDELKAAIARRATAQENFLRAMANQPPADRTRDDAGARDPRNDRDDSDRNEDEDDGEVHTLAEAMGGPHPFIKAIYSVDCVCGRPKDAPIHAPETSTAP
jgi:hypothetical protein